MKKADKQSLLAIIVLCLILGGCSSSIKDLNVTLTADQNLNPNRYGTPAPLFIMLYQLAAKDRFYQASFSQLYQNPKHLLGDDLIAIKTVYLKPNQSKTITWSLKSNAGYIGFLSAFRQINQNNWRYILNVNRKTMGKQITIHFTNYTMKQIEY